MSNKAIVETVGDHMYIDPTNGQVIEADRPVVVEMTSFVSQKIADGQIKLLTPNLPKEATDEDFLKTHDEFKGNANAANEATAAYAAEFGLDETGNTLPDGSAKTLAAKRKEAKIKADEEAARKNDPIVKNANHGKTTGSDSATTANLNDTSKGGEVGGFNADGSKSVATPNAGPNTTGTGKDNYQPKK